MTEETYQQARKIMQKANWIRGKITEAKGKVAQYTNMEDTYIQNMQPGRADWARKMILKAIEKLDEWRQQFKDLRFPDN